MQFNWQYTLLKFRYSIHLLFFESSSFKQTNQTLHPSFQTQIFGSNNLNTTETNCNLTV